MDCSCREVHTEEGEEEADATLDGLYPLSGGDNDEEVYDLEDDGIKLPGNASHKRYVLETADRVFT